MPNCQLALICMSWSFEEPGTQDYPCGTDALLGTTIEVGLSTRRLLERLTGESKGGERHRKTPHGFWRYRSLVSTHLGEVLRNFAIGSHFHYL